MTNDPTIKRLFGRLAITRVIRFEGLTPLENGRLSNGVYT
jgi:hypothetical protein